MTNTDLAKSYIWKEETRIDALEALNKRSNFSDVVREAQETVELALKGMLRAVVELAKRVVEDRPGHDLRYAMDISKITCELGWKPEESLQSGLAKTVDWYLSHQDWVERVATGEYERYFDFQYGSRLGST